MVRRNSFSIAALCLLAAACGGEQRQNSRKTESAGTRARALADAYPDGFLRETPIT
jgi:hypothetical protein